MSNGSVVTLAIQDRRVIRVVTGAAGTTWIIGDGGTEIDPDSATENQLTGANAGGRLGKAAHCSLHGSDAGANIFSENPGEGDGNTGNGENGLPGVKKGQYNDFNGRLAGPPNGHDLSHTSAYGYAAAPISQNQVVFGSVLSPRLDFWMGRGPSPVGKQTAVSYNVTPRSGVNATGGPTVYNAGQGTGTGSGGNHVFRVAPPTTPGSTQNPLVEAFVIDGTTGIVIAAKDAIIGGVRVSDLAASVAALAERVRQLEAVRPPPSPPPSRSRAR